MKHHRQTVSVAVNISATLVSVLAFPVYLYFFTAETYGLWFTITSLAGLCSLFELGATLPIQQLFLKNHIRRMWRLVTGIAIILVCSWLVLLAIFIAYLSRHFAGIVDSDSLYLAMVFMALSEVLVVFNTMSYALLNVSGRSLTCGCIRLSTEILKIAMLLVLLSRSGEIIDATKAHFVASLAAFLFAAIAVRLLIKSAAWPVSTEYKENTSFLKDLSFGVNQWVLNFFNKFSFRVILLLLERQLFQANLLTMTSSDLAKTAALAETGRAFIVYRVASMAFLL